MAVQACNLEPAIFIDGITDELEKQLKLKKFAHNNKSKVVQWNAVYCLLFPGEEIPSPCKQSFLVHIMLISIECTSFEGEAKFLDFEFLREENTHSLGATALSDLEGFLRFELPRSVEDALRNCIYHEAEPSFVRLRRELPQLIQECQNRFFTEYRSLKAMFHPQLHSHAEEQNGALITAAQSGLEYQQHNSAPSTYQYDLDTVLTDINWDITNENTNQNKQVGFEHANDLPEQEHKTTNEMTADPVDNVGQQGTQTTFKDTEHTEGRDPIDKFIEQYSVPSASSMVEDAFHTLPSGGSFDFSQFEDSDPLNWGA
jgi:hypothetical protein